MLSLSLAGLAAAVSPASPADKDPVICVRQNVGSEVGTHMRPQRICRKKSEWDFIEAHTKETLQSINQRGNNPGKAEGHAPQ